MDKTVCCLAKLPIMFFSHFFCFKLAKVIDPTLPEALPQNDTGFGVYKQIMDKMLMNPKMMALDPAALPKRHPPDPSGILKDCWD